MPLSLAYVLTMCYDVCSLRGRVVCSAVRVPGTATKSEYPAGRNTLLLSGYACCVNQQLHFAQGSGMAVAGFLIIPILPISFECAAEYVCT